MAEDDEGNGRVTLALLGQKVDALTEIVRDYHAKADAAQGACLVRLRLVEIEQARQENELHNRTTLQVGISAVLSALAASVSFIHRGG